MIYRIFVKGIIFSLNKRFSNSWSGSIDYTLQSAKGNASDPNAVADQRSDGVEPEVQLVPLNWDQTHTVNVTFSYSKENYPFCKGHKFRRIPPQRSRLYF